MCFTAKARAAIFTTSCDEHIATFAIRLTNHFSSTGKHVILFLDSFQSCTDSVGCLHPFTVS